MSILIIIVIFGFSLAYFATENTIPTSIMIGGYTLTVPLYTIVISSLFIGLLLSWIINTVNSLSSFFTIHGKNSAIKKAKKETTELTKKVHELELENTRLKTEVGEPVIDERFL